MPTSVVSNSVVNQYHSLVDDLSRGMGGDFSRFKVPLTERMNFGAGGSVFYQ